MLRNIAQYVQRCRLPLTKAVRLATTAAGLGVCTPWSGFAQDPRSRRTGGLTLQEVLDSALAQHPLAQAAAARVRAARGARTTARALGNPVLNYDVENAPFPGGDPVPGMARESMMTAMLPLETIFQRGPRARRADAEVHASEADASNARQQLALDAARTYFRTALAQVSVDAARDLTAWLDSVVAYNRTRVEQGVAAEADLIRAELERDRSAAAAVLREADLARVRAQLGAFLGDGIRPAGDLVVDVDDAPLTMPALLAPRADEWRADVMGRPAVRAARARLTATELDVSRERSMIIRELSATIGTKRSAGTTSMMAGLSVPLPVFDPNRGEIVRASAERDAAALDLAAHERTALAELTGAYDAARLLTERTALLARGSDGRPPFLARADEARRIALGAYREGAASLLQVIDAARAWNEARLAFYETMYAQHESVAALIVAHGDDLLTELPPLATRGHATPR